MASAAGRWVVTVKRTAAAVLCVLAAGAGMTAMPAAAVEDKKMERTITVAGSAQVSVEPDVARVTSGVTSEGDSAREALARNSDAMRKVIAALKAKGVDAKDIQTSSFHLEPKYTAAKERSAPAIAGYRVGNQVHVTVRNLARLGELLDDLVSAGANQLNGLQFDVSKADQLKDTARTEAVGNALRRARLLASAAGAEVGEVISIAEDAEIGPMPGRVMARAAPMKAAPIEAGTETLQVNVSVTWALK